MSAIPEFHRLHKSRTTEMNSAELKKRLDEEAARSSAQKKKKAPPDMESRKQKRISEQTKKQMPPQSPVRKQREQDIRRREKEELKEKKRRRKHGSYVVYYVMLGVFAAIVFGILSITVLFNTEKIIVEGASDYTDEEIIAASGLKGDENLVRLSFSGIPERMLDKLVSLDSVKLDKIFPSTIKITVKRSVPMANFSYNGKNYVISHIGRVMQISDEDADCMHVIGYQPAESVIVGSFISSEDPAQDELIADISAALDKVGLENITTVDISDTLSIKLVYDDRVEIYIGSALQLDQKLKDANELINNGYIGETEHVTLDITDPTRTIQRPITSAPQTEPIPEEESDEEGEEEGEGNESEPAEETLSE